MAKTTPKPKSKPAPPDPPKDQWVHVKLPANARMLDFLDSMGARSDRGGSPWNRSNVFRRQFDLFLSSLDESDPRSTRGFPQDFYDLVLKLLTEPWDLNATMIKLLPAYIGTLPNLTQLLGKTRVDRTAFLKALEELSFAERLHLVEAAQALHAPKGDPGSPDF